VRRASGGAPPARAAGDAPAPGGAPQGVREILYAPIEPDNDIVEFLARHFCDRFKNDPFIIHDKKRAKALVAFEGVRYVTDFTGERLPQNTRDEETYRALWRHYFDVVSIEERVNPRCQRRFMPVRYWNNITEMGR
jgi:probable DNA metabolism protein